MAGFGFATRAGQLTGCCEPLRRLREGLGSCRAGLSPPVILYY